MNISHLLLLKFNDLYTPSGEHLNRCTSFCFVAFHNFYTIHFSLSLSLSRSPPPPFLSSSLARIHTHTHTHTHTLARARAHKHTTLHVLIKLKGYNCCTICYPLVGDSLVTKRTAARRPIALVHGFKMLHSTDNDVYAK